MKKDIMLLAHFCDDFDSKGNNRFNYLADLFSKNDYDVEFITTDFSHQKKSKRGEAESLLPYRVTFIAEPGYLKNVSLKRFYSHYVMGRNLKKYLKQRRKKPDVIYCAVPSLDVACVAAKYAKANNIKFIIDVQDLWPETFKMVLRMPVISDFLVYPMKVQAEYVYRSADEIVAVSQTYVNRVMSVNKKGGTGHSVFLGTELAYFDRLAEENKIIAKPEGEIWLAYIGTLGHSYNLTCVLEGLKIIKDQCNVKFVVMGDGPLKSKFETYAKEHELHTEFTGRLDYGKMVGILTACDMTVNPITHGTGASIINKVADYAAAGLPVLNLQECLEYRNLVDEYQMGLNCENNNAQDFSEKLLVMCNDKGLRKSMGKNSRRLAEERFDREQTYRKIITLLKSG